MTGYAIDISHHQNPKTLPWDKFAGKVDLVIVRFAYGSELRDRHAVEHIRRAREIGCAVGGYIFYRPIHSVQKQFDLFRSVADQVSLGEGDLVPVVDIEHDPIPKPGTDVNPGWSGPVWDLVNRLDGAYGCLSMPYITQREWGMLGKPAWVLDPDRPLWVAHYTGATAPATPGGRPATLWQHRVGPFVPDGPGGYVKDRPELDQNRILGPLPLIGRKVLPSYTLVSTRGEEDEDLERHIEAIQFPWYELLESTIVTDDPEHDTQSPRLPLNT